MSNNNPRVQSDTYDPHIVPAETAARAEREQENYKQVKESSKGDLDTSGGYTVDQEGLANNYAIEPEMYVDEPGDLREEQAEEKEARASELQNINQTDEQGNLTVESDDRSKGVGQI
ncbi:hypothetical protein PN498_00660 [Oscillatoria sp. CS-180]|uniref:hypothetical protein n=1 Tax=Oscillatoria sp. CS-180 TaxID=3021720 RepID=UPI00232F500E|nr:hypothetical protein [Oscillatoria sp. CS-180]MDB9524483.1 hypothetical protein [Oscillatoria sp. CS-180]